MQEPFLSLLLDGKKTIESRFTMKKILPFNAIEIDDIIFFKKASGNVVGKAIVKDVEFRERLNPSKIKEIVNTYKDELMLSDEFLEKKLNSNYATLIWLKDVQRITPYHHEKHDQRTWIVLNDDSCYAQQRLPV
jgi:ASC-1-like (ASCH) protein